MDLHATNFITAAAYGLVQDAVNPPQQRIKDVIDSLPELRGEDVDLEESCPICLVPFEIILDQQEVASSAAKGHSQELEEDDTRVAGGLTKLVGCGHIFCRNDLIEWITSHHGSCPTCRHVFLDIRPVSESDDESSDGGEYVPNPDDFEEEDEDGFLDADGFTDASADDFPIESMELDLDDIWEPENAPSTYEREGGVEVEDSDSHEASHGSEWGLTDGESDPTSSSEGGGDSSMEEFEEEERIAVALEREVSVSVHGDAECDIEDLCAGEESK